jgi:hypothetical protein
MTEQQQHLSSPPQELRKQWMDEVRGTYYPDFQHLIDRAAQWAWDQREPEIQAAADAELEACIDVLGGQWEWDMLSQCTGWKEFRDQSEEILRAARRPKPPSLKAQALEALKAHFDAIEAGVPTYQPVHKAILRRAIAALPDG